MVEWEYRETANFEFDEFVDSYIADLKTALDGIPRASLKEFWKLVERTRSADGSIHFLGNGGSAATPSHSAGDWSKELGLRTIAHTDNAASLTAWANDTDYSNVFRGQLETFLRKGDLVVAYSGSGNSDNVLTGVRYANTKGCITVAVTGNVHGDQGGIIAKLCKLAIVVPTESMERSEDAQLVINHIIKEAVKKYNAL